jgi:hypothetical protein
MSGILGLISGKIFADKGFYSLNDRRRVFYDYPNGGAPLTGLLSLTETEDSDNPQFGWFEKRFRQAESTLIEASGQAPFSASGSNTASASPLALVAGTTYRLKVADSSSFLPGQVIWIMDLPKNGGGLVQVRGLVNSIVSATALEFEALEAVADILNTTNLVTGSPAGPVGATLHVIGHSVSEGSISGNSVYLPPINPSNYTQIFRTAFSFTRTALKSPTVFDKTGLYKDRAKDACLTHMTQIEKALMFGPRRAWTVNVGGDDVPQRTTGGVIQFLQDWEAVNSIYRGGTGAPAITSDANENKRIITNATGAMTKATYDTYLERLFRVTNNKAFEKICLCGSGHLAALNALIEAKVVTNKNMGAESTYGMNVVTVETAFGIVHFKQHPLFSQIQGLRYAGLYLDVGNLRYRALNDSDTTLCKEIQNNDYDGRKDEWLTEAGLECRMPESHMFIQNVQQITLS